MQSKKWKVIRIDILKLRQIRTQFRTICYLSVSSKIKHNIRIRSQYLSKKPMTPSQRKRYIAIGRELNELQHAYHSSILFCSMGSLCMSNRDIHQFSAGNPCLISLGLNMCWNPLKREWICETCYQYYKIVFKSDEYYNTLGV